MADIRTKKSKPATGSVVGQSPSFARSSCPWATPLSSLSATLQLPVGNAQSRCPTRRNSIFHSRRNREEKGFKKKSSDRISFNSNRVTTRTGACPGWRHPCLFPRTADYTCQSLADFNQCRPLPSLADKLAYMLADADIQARVRHLR